MQASKAATIIACVVFVLAVGLYYEHVASVTNPNPVTTHLTTDTPKCSPSATCNGFSIASANLTLVVSQDITSQELTLAIVPSGNLTVSKLQVYFQDVFVGNVSGPLVPGHSKTVGVAIPTTIEVVRGQFYEVFVEALYINPSDGSVAGDYWQSAFAYAS